MKSTLAFAAVVVALAASCARPCTTDTDCSTGEGCLLANDRESGQCEPSDVIGPTGLEGEGEVGEGEGEGDDGEGEGEGDVGEGEGEGEVVPPVVTFFVDRVPIGGDVQVVVATDGVEVVAEIANNPGDCVLEAGAGLSDFVTLDGFTATAAPATTQSDAVALSVFCNGSRTAIGTASLFPLAAEPAAAVLHARTEAVEAATLVTTTPDTSCAFADGAASKTFAATSSSETLTCHANGFDAPTVGVDVSVFIEVVIDDAVLVAPAGAGIVAFDVTGTSIESCVVASGAATGTPTSPPGSGLFLVQFPAAGPVDAAWTLTCSGLAPDAQTNSADFSFSPVVHFGNITDDAALTALPAVVNAIVGAIQMTLLDLDDPGATDVTGHPAVQAISGGLVLTDTGGGEVKYSFPLLREVGGAVEIKNNLGLKGLDADLGAERPEAFPLLESVGALDISGNAFLETSLTLPSLQTVSGALTFSNNNLVTSLALPSLRSAEGVLINLNGRLTRVTLTALQSVGSATPKNFEFSDNASDAGALGDVQISLPAALVAVSGQVRIRDNRRLDDAGANRIADGFNAVGGRAVSNNTP